MVFLFLSIFICLYSGCSFFQNEEKKKEQQSSLQTIERKDALYTDEKITLQINNSTPEQIDLFTTKYKNFSAETYLFFQPHIHQIVLDGQNPNWIPISEGHYCIEKYTKRHLEKNTEKNTEQELQQRTEIILPYANHCKKNSVLLSEFTKVLKTFVHSMNSCELVCGCAIRKGEMLKKHTSIAEGNMEVCVTSCTSQKNTCLSSCETKKNELDRSNCENRCRDISQSSFCDPKVSCCSLHR